METYTHTLTVQRTDTVFSVPAYTQSDAILFDRLAVANGEARNRMRCHVQNFNANLPP